MGFFKMTQKIKALNNLTFQRYLILTLFVFPQPFFSMHINTLANFPTIYVPTIYVGECSKNQSSNKYLSYV